MSVKIQGFTQSQSKLADMIWQSESMEEVAELVKQHGVDAIIARDMIIAAFIDDENDTGLAAKVLEQFML